MRGKRRWIIAGVVTAVLVIFVVLFWANRAERQNRREAAERFKKFRAARPRYRIVRQIMSPMGNSVAYYDDEKALLGSPQADALRAMGTNAAIYLAKEIRQGDSLWSRGYSRMFTNLPSGLRGIAPKPPVSRTEIRQTAALALGALGTNAAPGVPAVIEALRDCPRFSLIIWAEYLNRLPFEESDVDPLLAELTRRGDTGAAVDVIFKLHLQKASAARILANCFSTKDRPAKLRALGELNTVGSPGTELEFAL